MCKPKSKDTIEKVKYSISIMKDAYDVYNSLARSNLEADNSEMYWHWKGIAEGTRRSWELLEEILNIQEEDT